MRSRLTYSNVVSTICLFLLLGGAAYAAGLGKNSVKSKQIKDGQVKSQDIAPGAVTPDKIAPDSITGAQIDESTLRG